MSVIGESTITLTSSLSTPSSSCHRDNHSPENPSTIITILTYPPPQHRKLSTTEVAIWSDPEDQSPRIAVSLRHPPTMAHRPVDPPVKIRVYDGFNGAVLRTIDLRITMIIHMQVGVACDRAGKPRR
jgi:hypothetical protein